MPNYQGVWSLSTQYQNAGAWPRPPGPRALVGGGFLNSSLNTIEYFDIATDGNATDFGDLTVARYGLAAFSSATRGVFHSGYNTNTIDYVTIASTGNAADFGDAIAASWSKGGMSNSTRGVVSAGTRAASPYYYNTIEYNTIATLGNSLDFGDQTRTKTATTSLA